MSNASAPGGPPRAIVWLYYATAIFFFVYLFGYYWTAAGGPVERVLTGVGWLWARWPRRFLIPLCLALLVGPMDELNQRSVPGRSARTPTRPPARHTVVLAVTGSHSL